VRVAKFGGSALAGPEQASRVCDIVTAEPDRRVVVVSAPGRRRPGDRKVTDLLIDAGRARLAGRAGDAPLAEAIARYEAVAHGLDLPAEAVAPIGDDLRARLDAPAADEDLYLDALKAGGEDNCARLVAALLRARGCEARYVSPREAGLLLSEEPGNARVLRESYGRLKALRTRPGVTVFPGFFGFTPSGRLVTFPRGGSDITGAVLAAAVEADLYENFTDVACVYSADPGLVDGPLPIEELTYREMRELAYAGFGVFHDEALEPVRHAGIPVAVQSVDRPAGPGTRIVPARPADPARPVVGIAAHEGFAMVYVDKYLMNREVGFGRRLLALFEDEAVSFEHTPSGIDNMSVVFRADAFGPGAEERVVRRIRTELAADDVRVERDLALVMLVGEGMRHRVGLAARACGALARARVNIEMINQGASELSMMFGVSAADLPAAVRGLYAEFFS